MRRLHARLAAACAFAVVTAAFTGTALADPGHGNSANAPGQQQQTQPAAAQPTAQPEQQASQPTEQQQQSSQSAQQSTSSHEAPGQAKKQAATSSSSSSKQAVTSSTSSAGVKPSSTTTHWTHCVTGTSSSGATCTSSDGGHTPQTNADVSKQYGNGKTAAQIAVSRGGVGVQLTGPGNSQPHKVSVCGKPSNKSGGVDVHAVKSYDTSACTSSSTEATPPTAPCGYKVVATTTSTSHGHGKGLSHNKHVTSSTTYSVQPDSTQSCNTPTTPVETTPVETTPVTTTVTTTPVTTTTVTTTPVTTTPVTTTPVTTTPATTTPVTTTPATTTATSGVSGAAVTTTSTPSTQSASTPSTGGVLGAQAALATPKHASHRGVLGTVTHVAGGTLPFTGFPVWLAVLIALALILAGFALRRRTLGTNRL